MTYTITTTPEMLRPEALQKIIDNTAAQVVAQAAKKGKK